MCQINKRVTQKNSTYFLPNYLPRIPGMAVTDYKWPESFWQIFSGRNNENNLKLFHHFPNF